MQGKQRLGTTLGPVLLKLLPARLLQQDLGGSKVTEGRLSSQHLAQDGATLLPVRELSLPLCPQGPEPGQEGLEGYPYWEVGVAGTHSLQDTCLAQLLCHVSHIKKAWKLAGVGVEALDEVDMAPAQPG